MKLVVLRAFGRASQPAPWDNEESIREELFSIERLEQHAESLAAAQPVTSRPAAGRSLAVRLRDNESVLLEAYRAIATAVGAGRVITPAAEWLLDNYHLVEGQIREIRDDLPPGYYRQLPKLTTGPFAGYPQVFGVAWAFVAHMDSRFDPEMLRRFVRAYQRVQPLTIGELWAVAITLRIVLVENLRRGAKRIVTGRAARREADALADRLLGVNAHPAEPIRSVFQHYEQAPLPGAFAVQLVQRARGSKLMELEIARAALLAANNPEHQAQGDGVHRGERDPNGRKRDPGYYLIGGGRRTFEATVGFRAPLRSWLGRFNARIGIGGYIGSVIMIAAILLSLPVFALAEAGITGLWLGLLAFLGLIPSIDAAMALVNRSVTRGLGATILPGLEFRNGVPSHLRTMVAVPILLTTQAALEEQIERLEIHHLANPEDELHFALLSDWADAATETVAGDDALLDAAAAGIARLTRR